MTQRMFWVKALSLDRSKLIKVLNLTTSDADGEALNAIRMANKLLAKAEFSWELLLSGGAPGEREGRRYDEPDRDPEVQRMLEFLANEPFLTNWEVEFIESVTDFFNRRRSLTFKQLNVLRRIYSKYYCG